MAQTTLHHRLGSPDARLASYGGAETVAAFTDPLSELRALTSGCGVFDLAWRVKVTVKGRDRVRWLNGMVTNTIKDLPANRGNYSFALNSQGRILGDMYIYNRGEYLVLDTDLSQVEALMISLKRYIIMDQVELARSDESAASIGLCGPGAEAVLTSAGINFSQMQSLELRDEVLNNIHVTVVRGPEQKPGWYEIWTGSEHTEKIWEALVNAGAQPVGTDALELWRILQGIPSYGQDIRERDLPQETEQMQALNFTKGCYIGQEIVERIRSRGQVHRKFTGFEFPDEMPQPAKFEEGGRVVAEITSVARIGNRKIGLGYARRETAAPGARLNLGGTTALVSDLPFQIESNN
jgi:folate-binding protein YgfZ